MARASGREKRESDPAGRLCAGAFLRRPAVGDGGPPGSGTVVLVPRPAELLALVSPAALVSGTARSWATSRSESEVNAWPGMRSPRSVDLPYVLREGTPRTPSFAVRSGC